VVPGYLLQELGAVAPEESLGYGISAASFLLLGQKVWVE
jgi:hypothetical protein